MEGRVVRICIAPVKALHVVNPDEVELTHAGVVGDRRFWLVDAWWSLGRRDEARDLFVDALAYRNRYGLLSEDIDPQTGTLWGNFPQTYSMAGLILTAMRLSRSWEDRYWRG